jgi:riboflavin synthase
MFTGLVERTGELRARARRGPGYRLEIGADLGTLELGESIAVNGVCLTVAATDRAAFAADVSLETAERTTLGRLSVGAALNLERSLRLGNRLGGHLVSGHVDGLARVVKTVAAGESLDVECSAPAELLPFIAPKGSVALDGVSLTVNRVVPGGFQIMLIPHTQRVTHFGALGPGQELNLEVDLLARYVVHYLESVGRGGETTGIEGALHRAGLL